MVNTAESPGSFLIRLAVVPGAWWTLQAFRFHQVHVVRIAAVGAAAGPKPESRSSSATTPLVMMSAINLTAASTALSGGSLVAGVSQPPGFPVGMRLAGSYSEEAGRGHGISSFGSQYQAVVNCRPSVLRRPGLCTSGDEDQQAGELHALADAELFGSLDGLMVCALARPRDLRHGFCACSRKDEKSWRVQRVAHSTHHIAALGLDHGGGVGFERMKA